MKQLFYFVLFILFCAPSSAFGQGSSLNEEKVEGLGNVIGYFGKKLGKELGTRLNLEASDTTEVVMVPTKVKVKIGPFTMERTEYRPKIVSKKETAMREE